ncbi:hypothetical protein [Limosilactobacillus antri]|uniref:hypothetical protein n=1 Tax=Limosilactobacillus antri TaxID=227943 RepID=UPI001F59C486|nr:hypothetical protein [Limosilactobacillus antri]
MIDDSYKITLHTTDLPLTLNRKFYDDMIENFVTIQDSLNDIFETVGNKKQMADFNKKLSQLEARINRISQSGIDQVALEQAVEAVLKRKGVI